ncbi:MAG: transposase [Pirellulaceae bacterium]
MPRREIELVPGEHYHIYNRGANKQDIFLERDNYRFFLEKMREYLLGEPRRVAVPQPALSGRDQSCTFLAYCLMTNHYHFLVRIESTEFSGAMQSFSQSYSQAFNKRFHHTGTLFEGRFCAVHVDREEYLIQLSRYIHRNPLEARMVKRSEDWEFSSYREYLGLRTGTLPTTTQVLSQFESGEKYRTFVESVDLAARGKILHLLIDEAV